MFDFALIHRSITELRKKQIFFIGGTIKSGTTWLQLLLNAHPNVSCAGEGHFMSGLAPLLRNSLDRYNQLITQEGQTVFQEISGYPRLADDDFRYLLSSCIYLALLRQSHNKSVAAIGEKTPSNVRYFDVLHGLLPDAKFIHIVRDGRDSAVSGWFHGLRTAPHWTRKNNHSIDDYVTKHADYWVKELAGAQAFSAKNPDRIRQFRYEDLIASPEPVLSTIFAFVGVDVTHAILEKCISAASFATLSGGRKPGEEDRNSFFRRGLPGDWRNHISAETNDAFCQRGGEYLKQFGYI